MSITAVPSLSLLETSLLQVPGAINTKAPTTTSTPSTVKPALVSGTTVDAASTSSSTVTTLTKDLTSLLNSLVSGNVTAAKTNLAQLQTDLKTQSASSSTTSASGTATTSNPLDTLVGELSKSLTNGSTAGALQDLASYLVTTGLGTGTLVNTTA